MFFHFSQYFDDMQYIKVFLGQIIKIETAENAFFMLFGYVLFHNRLLQHKCFEYFTYNIMAQTYTMI